MRGATITLLFTFFTFLIMSEAESQTDKLILDPEEYSDEGGQCNTLREFLQHDKTKQARRIYCRVSNSRTTMKDILNGNVSIRDVEDAIKARIELSNGPTYDELIGRLDDAEKAIGFYNELVAAGKQRAASALLDAQWENMQNLCSLMIEKLDEDMLISGLQHVVSTEVVEDAPEDESAEDGE
mgnify:CR=1 FL=1